MDKTNQSSKSCTPPDYTVKETKDGRLINKRLGVYYPERPSAGYHSLEAHNKRKQLRQAKKKLTEDIGENNEVSKHFQGVKLESEVEAKLKKEEICLFYYQHTADKVDLSVRLYLGYKDEIGTLRIYPLTKRNKQWHLEDDKSGASFDSLESLVTHYKTFRCMDVVNGRLSLFLTHSDETTDTNTIYEEAAPS